MMTKERIDNQNFEFDDPGAGVIEPIRHIVKIHFFCFKNVISTSEHIEHIQ